jgi:predicted nucleic acid-binding Zn ribbon protein
MPLYEFACRKCIKVIEKRMTFEQHENTKDCVLCENCGRPMKQTVRFNGHVKLNGSWASTGYDLPDSEIARNLDIEKRIENESYEMDAKDRNIKEL